VARIRYADRGYAGFFDAVKVTEQTLDRVYAFDLALVESIDEILAMGDAENDEGLLRKAGFGVAVANAREAARRAPARARVGSPR